MDVWLGTVTVNSAVAVAVAEEHAEGECGEGVWAVFAFDFSIPPTGGCTQR